MDKKEIDRQIAEKVMEWVEKYQGMTTGCRFIYSYWITKDGTTATGYDTGKGSSPILYPWQPSTNRDQALEVVDKVLSEKHEDFTWEFNLSMFEGMSDATFSKHYERGKGKDVCWDAQNKETAMAICLAVLEAKND